MSILFRCDGVTKNIGDFKLENISFDLEPGMILGIIGINGSGKTTLIRTITGSYRLNQNTEDKGEIWINNLHFRNDQKDYRKKIAFIMQELPFSGNLYSKQVGELYGPYYDGYDHNKYLSLLNKYKIPDKVFLSNLSVGQKIRLQLAFMLSYDAELFILDEPVGNLDPDFRDVFYELLRDITAEEKKSVIISSHLVSELEHIADKLLWIGKKENVGYNRYFGTLDDLRESYRIFDGEPELIEQIDKGMVIGSFIRETHREAMLYLKDRCGFKEKLGTDAYNSCRYADLQEIMYYVEKISK